MSDGRKLPEQNAPRTSNPSMRLSNPGMRAMSAARAAPAEKATPQGPVGKRLASEASNQFLNGLSILKEMLQDFRTSDRFFKYKAGIVGGWVFISVLSIVIACPGQGVKTAELGARVTVLPNPDRPQAAPSLTVTNTDEDPWENVVFTVNGKYKAMVDKIDAGGIFTLTPKSLLSPTGPMPSDERFTHAEMRTDDGKAELVKEGVPLSE